MVLAMVPSKMKFPTGRGMFAKSIMIAMVGNGMIVRNSLTAEDVHVLSGPEQSNAVCDIPQFVVVFSILRKKHCVSFLQCNRLVLRRLKP